MANISPDMYRGVIEQGKSFISEAEQFLGINRPILHDKDVERRVEDGRKLQGRLEVFLAGLKKDSIKAPEYSAMVQGIDNKVEELKSYLSNYGK